MYEVLATWTCSLEGHEGEFEVDRADWQIESSAWHPDRDSNRNRYLEANHMLPFRTSREDAAPNWTTEVDGRRVGEAC